MSYDKVSKQFNVRVKDGVTNQVGEYEAFDYVIVASGHYSVPNIPEFPGIEKFPGRVMHAHDFRDACEFEGKMPVNMNYCGCFSNFILQN